MGTNLQERESVLPGQKSPDNGVSGADTPQSKVKESKVKKSAATGVSASLIDLSREFHTAQRNAFPSESCWRTDDQFERTIIDGAKELQRLQRIDGWSELEISRILRAVLKHEFWAPNIKSLRGIRKKSARNQAFKIENARTAIDSGKSAANGPFTYDQMLEQCDKHGLKTDVDFSPVSQETGNPLWQRLS